MNRVIYRITTDSGSDMTLAEDIVTAFEKVPEFVRYIRSSTGSIDDSNKAALVRREFLSKIVSSFLKASNDPFKVTWSGGSYYPGLWEYLMAANIHLLLEPLANMPPGTWKHTLSQMPEEVAQILRIKKVWQNTPAIILEYTRNSEMWKADCLIRG